MNTPLSMGRGNESFFSSGGCSSGLGNSLFNKLQFAVCRLNLAQEEAESDEILQDLVQIVDELNQGSDLQSKQANFTKLHKLFEQISPAKGSEQE